jgi:hypothetical protein
MGTLCFFLELFLTLLPPPFNVIAYLLASLMLWTLFWIVIDKAVNKLYAPKTTAVKVEQVRQENNQIVNQIRAATEQFVGETVQEMDTTTQKLKRKRRVNHTQA